MKVGFVGLTHLGATMRKACEIRSIETTLDADEADLVLVTPDVEDHSKLDYVSSCLGDTLACVDQDVPVILLSQVPPGFTRPWTKKRKNLFYQVDTIIMNRALERATFPERFIVGCVDPDEPLPSAYQEYLATFNCPVVRMGLESAELSKLAINYYLASQIEVANKLSRLARHIGADWDEMMPGLRLDARIGQSAYIRPGEVGGHLPRDIKTIERMLAELADA